MKRNFRSKKFTSRYTNINQSGIEKLRSTQLSKAKTYAEKKFFASNEFDKQIRRNIKDNRFNKNVKAIESISSQIGESQDQRKFFNSFFGEKTRYSKTTGKKIRTNSFTSLAQTKKLAKVQKQIKSGKFSLRRRVAGVDEFKETRQYLGDNPTQEEIAKSLTNTVFYYENKSLVNKHNKVVAKKGYKSASSSRSGQALRKKYIETLNEDDESLISTMLKG